jgi:hypothetical protein
MVSMISYYLNFLKDMSTLTSYIPLDASTLNLDLSFEIKWNVEKYFISVNFSSVL